MGRGGRIVIDRVVEAQPLFGNTSQEVYCGALPIAAVRSIPDTTQVEAPANGGLATYPFGQVNYDVAPSRKRRFQEVMQNQNTAPYYNLEPAFSFNMTNEMTVHVELVKRMALNRNTASDQIKFFL